MTIPRLWLALGALVLLVVAGALVAARAGWLAVPDAEVEARYRRPNSRFVTIDGVRFHYLDEGRGPAVVLLHGSYLDLGVWDGWVAALRCNHRVVRLDRTPFGLSSADPEPHVGYQREAALLAGFFDRLGLRRFGLVGTSSAGTSAARYASRHGDRVNWLALINFPLARRYIKPRTSYALSNWVRDGLLLNYQPAWQTRRTLVENLVDADRATLVLVRRLTDEANRPGILAARRRLEQGAAAYGGAARRDDLAAIRSPTLLMWGERNPLLSVASGRAAFAALGAPRKSMALLPDASHMIPVEKSAEALARLRAFLRTLKGVGSEIRADGDACSNG